VHIKKHGRKHQYIVINKKKNSSFVYGKKTILTSLLLVWASGHEHIWQNQT